MLNLVFRPRAALDIESIIIYKGEVLASPKAAKRWYSDFMSCLNRVCNFLEMGRSFEDEKLDNRCYRSILVAEFRVFYTASSDQLIVWRVVHTRQDIDDYTLVSS